MKKLSSGILAIMVALSASASALAVDDGPGPDFDPAIEVSPEQIDFGGVRVGETARGVLEIANRGEGILIVRELILVEGTHFDFCDGAPIDIEIVPLELVGIDVCFTPADARLLEDEVEIQSNDPLRPTVTVPVSGEGMEDPQDDPVGDLDVDTDRNGKIEEKDDGDEAKKVEYKKKGALVLANLDDDDGDPKKKKVDAEADNIITSAKDMEDFSKMIVRKVDLPEGWSAWLEIKDEGGRHIRVYREFGKGASSIMGPVPGKDSFPVTYQIPNADLAKDIDFYIEGITPGKEVRIQLQLFKGAEEQKASGDEVKILVTPIIFHPNTHKTDRMFYSTWRGLRGNNKKFINDFKPQAEKLIGKGAVSIDSISGTFVQDIFEIGYQKNPANHAGKQITMPTVVDVPWQSRSLNDFPRDELLKPDFGLFKLGGEVDDSGGADYGGNLETIPEFQADLPFGHLVVGENMSEELKKFLVEQKVQAKGDTKLVILPVDPKKGSTVFHVDEVINVVPSSKGKKFKVVIGDLDMAIDLLKKSGTKELKALKQTYTDKDNKKALDGIREQMKKVKEILKTDAGLADSDFVAIPVLYPLKFGPDGSYGLPNAVNLQVIDAKVFVPSPVFGTTKKGKSRVFMPFQNTVRKNLEDGGVAKADIIFVDTSEMSGFGGEAHCATNADRKPPK